MAASVTTTLWFIPAEQTPQQYWDDPKSLVGETITVRKKQYYILKYQFEQDQYMATEA